MIRAATSWGEVDFEHVVNCQNIHVHNDKGNFPKKAEHMIGVIDS